MKVDDDLKVTVTYYPVVWLEAPEEAGWSASNHMKAVWKKVDYATGYQIRLYRDDYYLRTIDATGTSKDLSEYMGREGNYYYEIRAVGKTTNDAKYRKSSEYIVSSDRYLDDLGDTEGSWKNYADGKKYVDENGQIVISQWYRILGTWYYFDENGYMVTGWRMVNNKWYYLGSDGKMVTGWKQIGGVWYYGCRWSDGNRLASDSTGTVVLPERQRSDGGVHCDRRIYVGCIGALGKLERNDGRHVMGEILWHARFHISEEVSSWNHAKTLDLL